MNNTTTTITTGEPLRDCWQGGHQASCPLSYPEVRTMLFSGRCKCNPPVCRDCEKPATVFCPVCDRALCDGHNSLGICRQSGSHRGRTL